MQKAITSNIPTQQMETHMYVVKDKKQLNINAASYLHHLFFGNRIKAVLQPISFENNISEPDYFSSYE